MRVQMPAVTPTSSGRRRDAAWVVESLPGRLWWASAVLAAVVWSVVAILQSPPLPLLIVVTALSSCGGLLVERTPWVSPAALWRYVRGALGTAVCVLALVGIGHHVEAGLTVVALLVGTSPAVLRWIART
jgi:hypothetical protein